MTTPSTNPQDDKQSTPRTDAAWLKAPRAHYGGMSYMGNFARTLERELNAANAEVEKFSKVLTEISNSIGSTHAANKAKEALQ